MAVTSPWKDADLFLQVVNGRGLSEATEARNYDTDNGKHFGVRLSQSLGMARVGGFFYTGEETLADRGSSLQVFGPDATLALGEKVEFNLQYLYRKDENPFFLESCARNDPRCSFGADEPLETEVDSYMGEMLFFPQGAGGNVHFTALYNRVEANSPIFTVRAGEEGYLEKYESLGFSANYLYARNVRLIAEVSRDLTLKRNRFIAGVTAAF
jgi:hypothetical protein